ncbi:MAG: hypothetical protein HDR72_00155 [Ruminococcaceae bacterium]|nr:hypothetical protein [Oscillospiraceae bacterium]
MKNYEEVAESVFKRSEEMIALNKRRRRDRLINIGATVGCLAVAGAVGIGVWKNAGHGTDLIQSEIQYPAAAGSNREQSDTVSVTEHAANGIAGGDNIIGVIPDLDPPDYPTLKDDPNVVGVTSESPADDPVSSAEAPASSSNGAVVGVTPNSPADTPAWPENPSAVSISDDDIIFPAYNQPDNGQPTTSNGESADTPNFLTVIEEYGTAGTISAGAPQNGTLLFTDALKGAMQEYGYTDKNGDIQYRVVVNYYDNGQPVDVNSSAIRETEWNRLCGHGYHCEFESCGKDWGNTTEHHLCMTLTRGQLESFTPCDSYGCTICLYGEKDCMLYDYNTSAPVPPVQSQQPVQTQPVQSQNGHHGSGHHSGEHC